MAKKCPPGKYYCFDDKKCKKIPRGYHIGARGYLARDTKDDDSETKKNGNGNSNGNGNGGNGSGNGNGGNGGNGGGNGGGGMGESIIYEKSNPRIPRKKGQPAKSKKHSDLYTDEDPKGTIHGLGFKDVAKAKASVSKIRNSSRSHAHKIQAAVAMEQRAREMGKTSEAAVYRKYINSMKKKTKRMNEENIDELSFDLMKRAVTKSFIKGTDPDKLYKGGVYGRFKTDPQTGKSPVKGFQGDTGKAAVMSKGAEQNYKFTKSARKKLAQKNKNIIKLDAAYNKPDANRPPMKESMGLITNAVVELEDGLKTLGVITYDSVDQLMQGISKRNNISPTLLHNQFKAKHLTIPDDWAIRYRMNKRKGIEEAKMTPAQKRKDTMLKKKYDDSDMKKNMQRQYGKEEGKKVYFATIRKQAMKKEEYISELSKVTLGRYIKSANLDSNIRAQRTMRSNASKDEVTRETKKIGKRAQGIGRAVNRLVGKPPNNVTPLNPPPSKRLGVVRNKDGSGNNIIPMDPFREETDKYNVSEEGLRDWFGKSSGTTKSGRRVRGWVQVGGKYDGKPCARQPGQKSTPKCVSSSKRRSMSKSERDSAARRKRSADPNQPQKSGAAKPTNVSTDPKRKMKKEEYISELFPREASRKIRRNRAAMIMRGGSPATKPEYTSTGKPDNSLAKMKEYDKKQGNRLTAIARGDVKFKDVKGSLNDRIGANTGKLKSGTVVGGGDANKRLGKLTRRLGAATAVGMLAGKLAGKFNEQVVEEKKETPKNVKKIAKELDAAVKMHTSQAKRLRAAGISEAKDKKGKGSGTKDACYHKVKARYDVWPSAYASGALVKCRKVGAANWGNKSKNEGFSPMQVAALEAAGMIEIKEGQKCWKGYEKKGTKMMFGKRYNNCVKKKKTRKEEVEHIDERMINVTPNAIRKRAAKQIIKKDLPKLAAGAGALAAGVAVGNKMTSTNEGVEFLKREKEKKKSKSEYLTQRDAGKSAKRKMTKKDQEKVNFLEPEETNESKTRLVKNGHTYKVVLTWRGKTYMVQMFVPSVSRPTRQEVEKEIQKLYPDAKVMSFLPRDLEPGEPTVMMGEENIIEDDMKGMSVKSGHKRPTKSGAGMTAKGVAAYRRRNPGSKLKTAVTGKVKKGSKDAKRRKSYCARSAGQMKKFPKAAKDPNSRLRQARRRWKC